MAPKFTLATYFEAVDHITGLSRSMEKSVSHLPATSRSQWGCSRMSSPERSPASPWAR